MMMQLYCSSISNYCSKVKLLIEYKKIDIEILPPTTRNVEGLNKQYNHSPKVWSVVE